MRKNLPVIKNAKDRRVSGGERALPQGRYTLTGSLKAALSPYARRFPYQKALSTDGHGST
jgi:hypothetical protein